MENLCEQIESVLKHMGNHWKPCGNGKPMANIGNTLKIICTNLWTTYAKPMENL